MHDARGESIGVILAQVSPGPNSVKCAEALTEYVFHNLRVSAPAPGRPNPNLPQQMLIEREGRLYPCHIATLPEIWLSISDWIVPCISTYILRT